MSSPSAPPSKDERGNPAASVSSMLTTSSELLRSVGVPQTVAALIAPYLLTSTATVDEIRKPSNRYGCDPLTTCNPGAGRQHHTASDPTLTAVSGITSWAASMFVLIKHLNSIMLMSHKSYGELRAVSSAASPSIPSMLTIFDYRNLKSDVMPKLVDYCLMTILTTCLDQTFTMSYIRSTVDCLCKDGYLFVPKDDEQADAMTRSNPGAWTRPYSHQALLLLRLLHAVSTASCEHFDKSEGKAAAPFGNNEAANGMVAPSDTVPAWLAATWGHYSNDLLVVAADVGGPRDDAISLRQPVALHAKQPVLVATSFGNNVQRTAKRRISLDAVDGGSRNKMVVAPRDCPGEPKRPKKTPRRGSGVPRLPPEVQLLILACLPPRHVVTAEATCYTWKYLIKSSCATRRAINASRVVRNVFQSFLIDDWGEKYLSIKSWSYLSDAEGAIEALRDRLNEEEEALDQDIRRTRGNAVSVIASQQLMLFVQLSVDAMGSCLKLWMERSRVALRSCKANSRSLHAPFVRLLEADPQCSWVISALRGFATESIALFRREVSHCRDVPVSMTEVGDIVMHAIEAQHYHGLIVLRAALSRP